LTKLSSAFKTSTVFRLSWHVRLLPTSAEVWMNVISVNVIRGTALRDSCHGQRPIEGALL